MKVIGLTGLPRSGKDTAAKYLEKEYGFKHFDFYRDALVPELERRGLEASKENATRLGVELRKDKGMAAPALVLLARIGRPEKAVFTGFRSPEEVEAVKEASSSFILAEVRAAKEIRFERRMAGEGKSLEDFLRREKVEAKEMGVLEVLAMADAVIDNSGSKKELEENLDGFMAGAGLA